MRFRAAVVVGLAVAAGSAAPGARSDEIVLRNGRTLTGKATESAGTVVFERPGVRMELRRDEVAEIRRGAAPGEAFAARLAKVDPKDGEAFHRLGLWAADRGLAAEARAAHERAVAADPDHAGARRALGHVRWRGEWRPEAEVMKERGFVRLDGAWVPAADAAAIRAGVVPAAVREAREARERERRHRRAINDAMRRLASPDAVTRAAGERALVAVAVERGDVNLEARAPEIRAYYDAFYAAVAEARARAVVDVQARWVTLKRPIPVFETSLGGFSSPVRLHLPEVSVVSISTTAVLPLLIDEE